ncbi:hypothetical protein SAMN04489761_3434 [Tenacibaculum sp. MAR_2009_124]|uniref:hypothetical protein n=1 Tax=Tenacibaculum sp. MAR_2009_124 TaxID=1250059 RepID=UPI0008956551|nr:hypothetical protein [Tenacibaculum sp. MAR_2009_124]SEC66293.1 hypothetical protein SAMN04489761_3434 [Tenacibaculum sp. MAR_2009_124]
MIECFPADNFYIATSMANDRIKELNKSYKVISIHTAISKEEDEEEICNVIVLFEKVQ